ncbi:MAG: HEAT repeat domain-containing protein [Polyangia bacterium]
MPISKSGSSRGKAALLAALIAVSCGGNAKRGELRVVGSQKPPHPLALIDRAEDDRRTGAALLDLVEHPDSEVRSRLAIALGRIGDPLSAEALVGLAGDHVPRIRRDALFSLGLLDEVPENARRLLVERIDAGAPVRERLLAIDALGRLSSEDVVPPLITELSDDSAEIRAAALGALGRLGRGGIDLEKAARRSVELLEDDNRQVRFAAAFALYGAATSSPLRPQAVEALLGVATSDDNSDVRAYAFCALARCGEIDEEMLGAALKDTDWRVRATAIVSLGLQKEEHRCPLAARALAFVAESLEKDPAWISGPAAQTAIAGLEIALSCPPAERPSRAAKRIERAIEGSGENLTAGAARVFCLARALGGSPDAAVIACDRERPHVGKRVLIERIASSPPLEPGYPELLSSMAEDPDPRVACAAIRALAGLGDPEAIDAVIAATGADRALVATAALDAIATHPETFAAEERLGATLESIRKAAARFGSFQHAWGALVAAAGALQATGSSRAEPVLKRLVTDKRPPVRRAALKAYRSIDGIEAPKVLPPTRPARRVSHEERQRWRRTDATATVYTTRGAFSIELFGRVAPSTVGSFTDLAEDGYFDDTEIHRVVPNFVVQAGDPTATGLGDPGYALRCEVSPRDYRRGSVGMALAGKDTGGSQFFVTLSPQPHLTGEYTVFGEVTEGMDTVDRLSEGEKIKKIEIHKIQSQTR